MHCGSQRGKHPQITRDREYCIALQQSEGETPPVRRNREDCTAAVRGGNTPRSQGIESTALHYSSQRGKHPQIARDREYCTALQQSEGETPPIRRNREDCTAAVRGGNTPRSQGIESTALHYSSQRGKHPQSGGTERTALQQSEGETPPDRKG